MTPAAVPDGLVEKAAEAMRRRPDGTKFLLPMYRDLARHALAAVLPEYGATQRVEAVTEARKVISQYLATAEEWRYDRVMWAFAIMLGEIPEDAPCPDSPADARERAARLTTTTEKPTT